jgi:hypothetical protein
MRLFGWAPWLSLSPLLHQWCLVSSTFILHPDEDGSPLHVISTSSSLKIVKTDTVPLLAVFPTLINNVWKSWKVFACCAHADSLWNGSRATCFAWFVPPFATPTLCVDCHRMGRSTLT